MNWNDLKTTSAAYFPRVNGVPCWKLNFLGNVWDTLIDRLAAALSLYQDPGTTQPVTVGPSPFTYTAGTDPEVLYISGGAITSITRNGVALSPNVGVVVLPPGGQVVIAYTSAPTVVSDSGALAVNSAGVTAAISVGASPFTYTASGRMEVIYISDGAVTSVTRNGVSLGVALPMTVLLPRGGSLVVTYTSAPTMVRDS